MQNQQQAKVLQEIASSVVNESPESMKLAIVDNNAIAGILKNLLIKAKHVPKNQITHVDYYTSEALPTPKGCDIAIVSTMHRLLRQFKIIPPPSCKEIVIFQESSGTVKIRRLGIPDRMEGTPINIKLS